MYFSQIKSRAIETVYDRYRATIAHAKTCYTRNDNITPSVEKENWFKPFVNEVSWLKNLDNLIKIGKSTEKGLAIRKLGSNPTLLDRKLNVQAHKPFVLLLKNPKMSLGGICALKSELYSLNTLKL